MRSRKVEGIETQLDSTRFTGAIPFSSGSRESVQKLQSRPYWKGMGASVQNGTLQGYMLTVWTYLFFARTRSDYSKWLDTIRDKGLD
jgi:hypothetical protein